jgi:hypothetical protein
VRKEQPRNTPNTRKWPGWLAYPTAEHAEHADGEDLVRSGGRRYHGIHGFSLPNVCYLLNVTLAAKRLFTTSVSEFSIAENTSPERQFYRSRNSTGPRNSSSHCSTVLDASSFLALPTTERIRSTSTSPPIQRFSVWSSRLCGANPNPMPGVPFYPQQLPSVKSVKSVVKYRPRPGAPVVSSHGLHGSGPDQGPSDWRRWAEAGRTRRVALSRAIRSSSWG